MLATAITFTLSPWIAHQPCEMEVLHFCEVNLWEFAQQVSWEGNQRAWGAGAGSPSLGSRWRAQEQEGS